jgi:transcription elongation factor GreA
MASSGEATPTLTEAASRYLASLPPQQRQESQPEVYRFVRWYGAERRTDELRGHDVSAYAEALGATAVDSSQRLEVLRGFFAFVRKQGFAPTNLATHLRLRKTAAPAVGRGVAMQEIHLTPDGHAALLAELGNLRSQRPRVAEELRRAMADKDFRENAPLDAAREHQAYLEARIREIEATLKRAVIVVGGASPESNARIGVGSTILLRNLKSGAEVRYILVSPSEVNPAEGKISFASPVGKALLERSVGEEVDVKAPAGTLRFRIESVEA